MPFRPTPRAPAPARLLYVTEWCNPGCGKSFTTLGNGDGPLRDIWNAVHDQHAAIDRYADEEKD